MPNDLSIQASPAATLGSDAVAPSRPIATFAAADQAAVTATPASSPSPNPVLQLDAALGLVVLEFRNDAGTITSSIPTQQQIAAYQQWQERRIGPAPQLGATAAGGAVAAAPAPTIAPAPAGASRQVPAPVAAPVTVPAPGAVSRPEPNPAPQVVSDTAAPGGNKPGAPSV